MDKRKIKKIYQKGKRKDSLRYVMECLQCKKEFEILKRDYNRGRGIYCSNECNKLRKSGKFNGMWKGGYKISMGYKMIHKRLVDKKYHYLVQHNYYIPEHRLIVAKNSNKKLSKKDIVHHLNGKREDNRFENLVVVNSVSHEKHTFEKLLKKRILELEEIVKNKG